MADDPSNLRCRECGNLVPDHGMATRSAHHAAHQRAVCHGCGARLIRHPELPENGWMVETRPSAD